MSAEHPKVSASFTNQELQVIKRVQNLLKLNTNQFTRRCMIAGINAILCEKIVQSTDAALPQMVTPIIKELFNEKKLKKIETRLEKEMKKTPITIRKKAEEEIKLLNDMMQVFYTHNPVGAPSQKPGKRGRPKDIGLDKSTSKKNSK